MFRRFLDDQYATEVRERITLLTTTRTVENAAYRYAPPFLATIASGLGVSLSTIGIALSITELGGLFSPLLGRLVDGWPRRGSLIGAGSIVAVGTLVAGLANGMVMFTIGLFTIALAKTVFDLTINAWIAGHTDYARRARVVGIVETSWAGGLLIGVPILGLVTAAFSWRAAYALAAIAMLVSVAVLSRGLEPEQAHQLADRAAALPDQVPGWWKSLIKPVAGLMCLMGASQCAFVTFGSWLQDDHGFTAAGLAGVTFVFGAFELVASSSTMRLTDRLGKRNAVMCGAALIIPTAGGLALGLHHHAIAGLVALALLLLGFEFAIVSALSLASNLVPGRPGSGIGAAFGAGTLGRAMTSLVATRLYEAHGMAAPMLLACALAASCIGLLGRSRQLK